MSVLQDEDIKAIVLETLGEQQRLHRNEVDAIALRAVATTLMSFGIDDDDRKDVVSANNFIKCGYQLYEPRYPWGWPQTLCWRKSVARRT